MARLDGFARARIGLAAKVFVADTRVLLDRLGVERHHLHLTGRHLAVAVHLELLVRLVDHHAVGLVDLLASGVDVLHGAVLGEDLVRGKQKQRLGRPLVQILLEIAHAANHTVGHTIAPTAVAPDRRQAETVVPHRHGAQCEQMRLCEHRHMHAHDDAVHNGPADLPHCLHQGAVPRFNERALERTFCHHLHRHRHAELALDQTDALARLAVDVAAPARHVTGAGVRGTGIALVIELVLGPLLRRVFVVLLDRAAQHI